MDLIHNKAYILNHSDIFQVMGWVKTQIPLQLNITFMTFNFMGAIYIIGKLWKNKKTQRYSLSILTIFIILYLYWSIYTTNRIYSNYIYGTFYLLLLLLPVYTYWQNKDWKFYTKIGLLILGCSLCSIAGSDIGLQKLLMLPLIPIICTFFLNKEGKILPIWLKRYLIIMGMVTIAFIPAMHIQFYGFRNTVKCDFNERLNGAYMTLTDYNTTKSLQDYIANESKEKVLFIGGHRYLYYYMTNTKDPLLQNFQEFHMTDEDLEKTYDSVIKNYSIVCLLKSDIFNSKGAFLENYFFSKGFERFPDSNLEDFIIWKRF